MLVFYSVEEYYYYVCRIVFARKHIGNKSYLELNNINNTKQTTLYNFMQ